MNDITKLFGTFTNSWTLEAAPEENEISAGLNNIMSQPKKIVNLWMDFCKKICEREELLSWS